MDGAVVFPFPGSVGVFISDYPLGKLVKDWGLRKDRVCLETFSSQFFGLPEGIVSGTDTKMEKRT